MSDERFDAVVIGAGLGGLAAGVELSGAGQRVLVVEHHTLPGGYAQGFQRGPFRFDVSLHALDALAPGGGSDRLLQRLGIWDRLVFERLDPLYAARFPEHEIVAGADLFSYEATLIDAFPHELTGIRGYLDELRAVWSDVRRREEDARHGHAPAFEEFIDRYPSLVRASGETWQQVIERHVHDPRLQGILGAYSGYFGLPPSRCAALVGVVGSASYHEHGGWYPHGGSQAMSRALERVLKERGGAIRYGEEVTEILVAGGRATGIRTASGHTVDADVVVSNANAPDTVRMARTERFPSDYLHQVTEPRPSYTTFAVYLGLSRDVFAEQGLPHELFVFPSYDQEQAWAAADAGDWSKVPLAIADYTRIDPGCAPAGWSVVTITVPVAWDYENVWGTGGDLANYHANPRYQDVKAHVTDRIIARAADHLPGILDSIVHRESSTPLTNFEYTHNPRGAIEGYENTPSNSGMGWLPNLTPIPNLVLAGAWTNSGGQIPALASGVQAAGLASASLAGRETPTQPV